MAEEEIKKYLKENLRLEWEWSKGKYYVVLRVAGEKVTELGFEPY